MNCCAEGGDVTAVGVPSSEGTGSSVVVGVKLNGVGGTTVAVASGGGDGGICPQAVTSETIMSSIKLASTLVFMVIPHD
jgi:hypothetical protein